MTHCPLCGREMVEGPSVDLHHLVPKSKKGKETVLLHLICHRKIHSLLSEKEIATKYNTIAKLQEHEDIKTFIEWVSKKNPEFVDTFKDSRDRKKKRK